MESVSGFWVGAAQLFSARRVNELRDAVGGWSNLRTCQIGDLVALGVSEGKARRWRQMDDSTSIGVVITQEDSRYPSQLLSDCVGAPPVLFVEGNADVLALPAIAIVGTRGCTGKGRSMAQYLAERLSGAGWCVVSGLARGIDAAAHQGAVSSGKTLAVLGHGLGFMSPISNTGLRREIVRNGGAVVSAWPDDTPAERWTFPARNRWIAGLCRRVVVVEAPEGSGALYTVEAARALGREVHLLPDQLGRAVSAGGLSELNRHQRERGQFLEELARQLQLDEETVGRWLRGHTDRLRPDLQPIWSVSQFLEDVAQCEPDIADPWLQDLFSGTPLHELCERRGISTLEILSELALLELRGVVVRLPGQRYAAGNTRHTP